MVIFIQNANETAVEILSHWHPNLTINLIDDHTPWTRGHVPAPLDDCQYTPHQVYICYLMIRTLIKGYSKAALEF